MARKKIVKDSQTRTGETPSRGWKGWVRRHLHINLESPRSLDALKPAIFQKSPSVYQAAVRTKRGQRLVAFDRRTGGLGQIGLLAVGALVEPDDPFWEDVAKDASGGLARAVDQAGKKLDEEEKEARRKRGKKVDDTTARGKASVTVGTGAPTSGTPDESKEEKLRESLEAAARLVDGASESVARGLKSETARVHGWTARLKEVRERQKAASTRLDAEGGE